MKSVTGRAHAQHGDASSAGSSEESLSSLADSEEAIGQSSYDHGDTRSKDDRLSLSTRVSSPRSSRPLSTGSSSSGQQQHVVLARPATKKKNGCTGRSNTSRRSQFPLRQVVARRAFECLVGAHGGLSKVLDAGRDHNSSTQHEDRDYQTELDAAIGQHDGNDIRSVEPVPCGEDIRVGGEDSSEGFWGVDLHMCDLRSLVGLPVERGASPWAAGASRNDSDKERSWRCVYLDASLNRLRGITVIADQPCLCGLVYLDLSHNLVEDLASVQDLPSLQVLLVSNNQIGSMQALGECWRKDVPSSTPSSSPPPPSRLGIRHADLSNNSIATVEAPLHAQAFRNMKSLRVASNHLGSFEEEAAHALTSLERLDVSDNELVSIEWVALLESLRFLDCSENRVSALPTFARALAGPPRLEEVIAEENPVVKEPQYRITILTKCKRILRLDHRPVDAGALKRQLDLAAQRKALNSVRETANDEYHRSVEGERSRLERRKEILRAQERQLDEAFQGYRLQKQQEMGECVAYAESLRSDEGRGLLTPRVAHAFRENVGSDRRLPPEIESTSRGNAALSDGDRGGGEEVENVHIAAATEEKGGSLKVALIAAVDQEHPESVKSEFDRDGSENTYDDATDHGSAFGGELSSSEDVLSGEGSRRHDSRQSSGVESGRTGRRGGARGHRSARVRAGSKEKIVQGVGGGGGDSRGGLEPEYSPQTKPKRSATIDKDRRGEGRPDDSPAAINKDLPTKKSGGGGGGIFKTLGWRRAER